MAYIERCGDTNTNPVNTGRVKDLTLFILYKLSLPLQNAEDLEVTHMSLLRITIATLNLQKSALK